MDNSKIIAAFDFDGTITHKDTLLEFLRFCVSPSRLVINTVSLLPLLTAYKLKLISNNTAKEKLFTRFFGDMPVSVFNDYCQQFARKIPLLVNPDAIKKLNFHLQNGHRVIIVSASIENWILPWAQKNGVHEVLATRVEVVNGRLTGKFLSPNCYGAEKVIRLKAAYPAIADYQVYAYGDSNGDKELLSLAHNKFYRCFE